MSNSSASSGDATCEACGHGGVLLATDSAMLVGCEDAFAKFATQAPVDSALQSESDAVKMEELPLLELINLFCCLQEERVKVSVVFEKRY